MKSSIVIQNPPQENNKGAMIDHEGFHQIKGKRSTRRNIFEEEEEEEERKKERIPERTSKTNPRG